MDWVSKEKKRRYFRLRYPRTRRPRIEVNDGMCEVVEVSEGGLRLRAEDWDLPEGSDVIARIHFSDGEVCFLNNAEVHRVDKDEVVIVFTGGVSLKRMAKEQRKILRASILEGDHAAIEALRLRHNT